MGSGVSIRATKESDRTQIGAVIRSAFEQDDEAELVDDLVDSMAYMPELEFIAEENGEIVGHVMFTRVQIEETLPGSMMRNIPAIILAPLAVLPDQQNRGIGGELVREGLKYARMRGEGIALVLGHPIFYQKFGFHEALPYDIHAPRSVPSEGWMVVELVPSSLQGVRGVARLGAPFDDPHYW